MRGYVNWLDKRLPLATYCDRRAYPPVDWCVGCQVPIDERDQYASLREFGQELCGECQSDQRTIRRYPFLTEEGPIERAEREREEAVPDQECRRRS